MQAQKSKIFSFEELHRDPNSHARVGRVHTAHGSFETPVFMPVGTQATVKALAPRDLEDAGAEIILSNAYHLYIKPGIDIIKTFGTLHRFMGWNRPILTDSGGYQVFSLSRLREISDEGVKFRSHFDGREIFLNPESVVEIQEAIGSDIAMIFDECPPPTRDRERVRQAVERTLLWAKRAKAHHKLETQALFGIVQGGTFPELRKESLERTVEIGFDGYALGGLCVGESKADTLIALDAVLPSFPEDKPRYLMGVGTPVDFLESIARGADMFDCVNPTRYGRNGAAFTSTGLCVVRNAKYQRDERPLEAGCGCYTCRHFTRSYLRHLLNAEEMLGPQLLSIHNVTFFVQLVKTIREKIREGRFLEFKKNFLNQFDPDCR
jgi:queuine tRNA-ribosyltransferase